MESKQGKEQSIPRPEHPQPQMERESWRNLNGIWEFAFDFGRSGRERRWFLKEQGDKVFTKTITVPFCPESRLSGIGYTDFIPAVWYRRFITLTGEQCSGRVLLHFGAVDYRSTVYINGREAGRHRGAYTSFQFDITELVHGGENEIVVYAEDDCRDSMQPRGKQCEGYYSQGCDYTRTTGIWQTVWLEFVPGEYIRSFRLYPQPQQSAVWIRMKTEGNGPVQAEAFFEGRPCGKISGQVSGGKAELLLSLSECHLWEAGKGALYELKFTFGSDTVKSYIGLREIALENGRFLLNGKTVFQRLVLDQGFYPDGIYTAPTEEALIQDIELSMKLGFNGARLHQKVFEPRFLYHCDRLGYLVWGEEGNWGLDLSDPASLLSFLPEWMEAVERDFNHPAIIGWCPFNETWDYAGRRQRDEILAAIYRVTKELDDTRPCIDTSGNFHVVTDIYDLHNYMQDPDQFRACYDPFAEGGKLWDEHAGRQNYQPGLPVFISEYGGIKWAPEQTEEKAWGYGEAPKTEEEFIDRYRRLTSCLLENPKIMGFCYTQLYDVEQEVNGLCTYERKLKFDPERIRAINQEPAAIETID